VGTPGGVDAVAVYCQEALFAPWPSGWMVFHEVAVDCANAGDVEWGWVGFEDYL
jgi:hypothetical protein